MRTIITTKMNNFCLRTLSKYEFQQNLWRGIKANNFFADVRMDL